MHQDDSMPNTGATGSQIEAAAAKWTTCPEKDRPVFREIVADYAAMLVPPGSRIFEEEDVAALRRLMEWATDEAESYLLGDDQMTQDLDRLAALVDGS